MTSLRHPSDKASGIGFDELLILLGHTEAKRVVVCHQRVGVDEKFLATGCKGVNAAATHVDALPLDADVWFGVNSRRATLLPHLKGKEGDCIELAALWADLDIAEDKCPDNATAHAIVAALSALLGARPVAVVFSGHGWQPYWRLADEVPTDFGLAEAKALVRRWGKLVATVAVEHGARKADGVYNLDRVMRVPGTLNCKQPDARVETFAESRGGSPVTVAHVLKLLDHRGIQEGETNGIETPAETSSDGSQDSVVRSAGITSDFTRGQLINRVKSATEGRRNNTLHGAAKDAAKQGDWDTDMRSALTKAAADVGLPDAEIVTTLASATKGYALKRVESLETVNAGINADRSETKKPETAPKATDAESFWSLTPLLTDLRTYARARRVGPLAMLGHVLARVVTAIPPTVVLPPLIGSHASLNVFVALVGPSGSGKGGAAGAAADWLATQPETYTATLGSGEGMAKCYAYKERTGGNGPWTQTGLRASVLFDAPEVDNLAALSSRNSSTLLPQLRSAYSGEELGFSYADPTKAVRLCAHRYRLCLTVGVQPGRGRALLDDADGGTPQRFVWLPTGDPDAPETPPALPARLTLPRWPDPVIGGRSVSVIAEGLLDTPATPAMLSVLGVPDLARDAIDQHRLASLRGKAVDPLDGHRLLCRLKIAAALMALHGRTSAVTEDDWERAGIVMSVSDATRKSIADTLSAELTESNRHRGRWRANAPTSPNRRRPIER